MDAYFPELCVWETTLACNLACRHCGSSAGRARPEELTTSEALDLLHQLADLGTRELTLSGGELFLRADWRQLLTRARSLGLRRLVVSNGLALGAEVAAELARQEVGSVSLSLDGGPATHDRLRPLRGLLEDASGSFAGVLRAARCLKAAGVTVAVITQVSRSNLRDLPAIRAALVEHDVRHWQVQLTNPMGRAGEASGLGVLAPAEVAQVHEVIRATQREGRIRCVAADNIGYFGPEEHLLRSDGERGDRFWTGCQAGLRVIGITSDGGVKGCLSMQDAFLEGNVRARRLADIWRDPRAFAYNRRFSRETLTGACATCEFGALCRAGCRSYAFAATGRISESPCCVRATGT